MTEVQESQFSSLYKTTPSLDQNKRREELLAEQKKRRENLLDEARGIEGPAETSETEQPAGKLKKPRKCTKYEIMLSEWFLDIAPDLDVSWFMKLCPNGHRNLVVAEGGSTKSFDKRGRFECAFESFLPGGKNNGGWSHATVLDCIWNGKNNTFYILDVLCWGSQDLRNCEAEFRFFWLQTKLSEHPEISQISSNNAYSFKYVPHFSCDQSTIKENLEHFPYFENNRPYIDGILFYHKEASYTPGSTPLVGWLKPFMVPEKLNVQIAEEYMRNAPDGYSNTMTYIEKFEAKKRERRRKKNENNVEMQECEQ